MFHSRKLNNKINKLHERALRVVYDNPALSFEQLLDLDGSITIHHKNLHRLAIEMYKVKNNLSSPLVKRIFTNHVNSINLRNKRCWEIPKARTVLYGTETIRYRGPKTWEMIPNKIKESHTLLEFKRNIKHWRPTNCTCRLCKIYIRNLGFI